MYASLDAFSLFVTLVLSIIIASMYYVAERKRIDFLSLLAASIASYSLGLVLVSITVLFVELPSYVESTLRSFVPLAIAVNLPLLVVALRNATKR